MNRDGARPPTFSIAVLAGGESSRMGGNKALKTLGEKPVISHVIDSLSSLSSDIFIVAGDVAAYEHLDLPVCADHYPQKASLVGIYSALAAARFEYCFSVACDMPFVEASLVNLLAGLAPGYEAVVPVSRRGAEPTHAIYSRVCLGRMREKIEAGDFNISEMLDALKVRYVELGEMISLCNPEMVFLNVNSVVDLEEASRLFPQIKRQRELAHFAERLPDMPPLICFVGRKDSGKTTFLEKLIPELARRRVAVACIKHDSHGFAMDREGTDTDRLARAGAKSVTISSPWALASIEKPPAEKSLAELHAAAAGGVDLVIAEGYKTAAADKIEISRGESADDLACPEDELVAVISSSEDMAVNVPVFDFDDVEAIANLIMIRYGLAGGGSSR